MSDKKQEQILIDATVQVADALHYEWRNSGPGETAEREIIFLKIGLLSDLVDTIRIKAEMPIMSEVTSK